MIAGFICSGDWVGESGLRPDLRSAAAAGVDFSQGCATASLTLGWYGLPLQGKGTANHPSF